MLPRERDLNLTMTTFLENNQNARNRGAGRAHGKARRGEGRAERRKGPGRPPLSVTVVKHLLSHHSGLRFQLLHLLQQRLPVGMLGPVSRERDSKDRMSCSCEDRWAVPLGGHVRTPRDWLRLGPGASWSTCDPRAWRGLPLPRLGSTPRPVECQKPPLLLGDCFLLQACRAV